MSVVTPEQLISMLLSYSGDLDTVQGELSTGLNDEADARKALTKVRAEAWRQVTGPNREFREALVDEATVEEKHALDLATAVAKSKMEEVRNKRQQLSSLQTVFNAYKEEALFTRTGQDDVQEQVDEAGEGNYGALPMSRAAKGVFDEAYVKNRAPIRRG